MHARVFLKQSLIHGANFASSPARILIDFKDPIIVAEKIAKTDKNKIVTSKDIAKRLGDNGKRVGGSFAKGKRQI